MIDPPAPAPGAHSNPPSGAAAGPPADPAPDPAPSAPGPVGTGAPPPGTSSMTAGPWRSLARRVQSTLEVEFGQLRPQLVALSVLASPLPTGSFASLRAQVLRLVGFRLGPGTLVHGLPQVTGGGADLGANLVVGAGCVLERGCVLELGERITLGDRVTVAAEAMILTTTHELGPRERRAGPLRSRPVVVGTGVTIGTRAIVLPGVTIGEGAEVLAGSVVTKDVPPRTRWGGVPARLLGPVES